MESYYNGVNTLSKFLRAQGLIKYCVNQDSNHITIQEATVKFDTSEFIKRKERTSNLKMNLVIVVDTEDQDYKQCMSSIIQMFNLSTQIKEISNAQFIMNGQVLQTEKAITQVIRSDALPFKNSISQLQILYESLKASPVLVLIFTNKTSFIDYPNLSNFCLNKDILVQCVIQPLKVDVKLSQQQFAHNLGSLLGLVEPMFDGFMEFDEDTKVDVLLETLQNTIQQTKINFQNSLVINICDELKLNLTLSEFQKSQDYVELSLLKPLEFDDEANMKDLFEIGIEPKFVFWSSSTLQCPFRWEKTMIEPPKQPPPQLKQPEIINQKKFQVEEEKKEQQVVQNLIRVEEEEEEEDYFDKLKKHFEQEVWTIQGLDEALQKCEKTIQDPQSFQSVSDGNSSVQDEEEKDYYNNPQDMREINEIINQIRGQIQQAKLRGDEAPTPGQIKAVKKIVENVIEKKKSKKKVYPHLIKGMKTREQIEKIIVDHLILRKNDRSNLICENDEVQMMLGEVAVKLTKVVYRNKMSYSTQQTKYKGDDYLMYTFDFKHQDKANQPQINFNPNQHQKPQKQPKMPQQQNKNEKDQNEHQNIPKPQPMKGANIPDRSQFQQSQAQSKVPQPMHNDAKHFYKQCEEIILFGLTEEQLKAKLQEYIQSGVVKKCKVKIANKSGRKKLMNVIKQLRQLFPNKGFEWQKEVEIEKNLDEEQKIDVFIINLE